MRWFIVCVVLTVCNNSFAQISDRNNYQLLWKISGNELKKPSYLFGTFHVQDKRAFDVSDSVLLKINECEAFALEFHPDSVTKAVVNLFLHPSKESGDPLKNQMPPAEFSRLDSLMKQRTGVSLSEFKSPSAALRMLSTRSQKKDYRTFLDAWLYNIARSKNKLMFGLEEYRSQVDLLNKAEFERKLAELTETLESDELLNSNLFDSLLKKYEAGDIESIRGYMRRHTSASEYKSIITDRNIVMAKSITAMIHRHSSFIAVGAGHLAGEEGLIQLLRDAGYSLAPVKSKFSGLAAKYDQGSAVQEWAKYKSPDGGYSIEMPQPPVSFSPGNVPITFQTHFDIGTMTLFMATHFPLSPEFRNSTTKKILDDLEKKISGTVTLKDRSKVITAGSEGRELEVVSLGQNYKVQLFVRPPMAYMLMVGPSETALESEEGRRFFASFKTENIARTGSHDFKHDAGAFTIEMPGKPSYNFLTPHDPSINRNYKIHLFQTGTESGESFFIRYNDFPAGFVSPHDSTYLGELLQNVVGLMKGGDVRQQWGKFGKFPLLDFSFKANEGLVAASGKLILRGNRTYLIMNAREAKADSAAAVTFLNSFKLIPYINTPAKSMSFPEGITLNVPVTFESDSAVISGADGFDQYAFLDANSGTTYVLEIVKFKEYEESDSADAFFESTIRKYTAATDSIISSEPITLQEFKGHDYIVKSAVTNALKRIRFVACGDQLISLWGYLPSDHSSTDFSDNVFKSFSVKQLREWNLFEDKTERLLQDIVSKDSLKSAAANEAVMDHEFRRHDLPSIYNAISATDFSDSLKGPNSAIMLLNVLNQVNDETTPKFIHRTYNALPETSGSRDYALAVLAHMGTRETVHEMMRLIQQDSLRSNISGYVTLEAFYDSLQLLDGILPHLIYRHSSFTETETLFELTTMALDSAVLSEETKAKVLAEVLRAGGDITNALTQEDEANSYRRIQNHVNLAKLLVRIPFSSPVKELLLRLHASRHTDVMAITAPHLLKHNVNVPKAEIDRIAAKPIHRLKLFESLKEIGKEKLMNKRYRTKTMLAESDLCEYMAYEDGVPHKIELVAERAILVDERKQMLYIFKYQYEDSDEWYLGMSGGHDEGKNTSFSRGTLTVSFYETYSSEDAVNDQIRGYLEENGAALRD